MYLFFNDFANRLRDPQVKPQSPIHCVTFFYSIINQYIDNNLYLYTSIVNYVLSKQCALKAELFELGLNVEQSTAGFEFQTELFDHIQRQHLMNVCMYVCMYMYWLLHAFQGVCNTRLYPCYCLPEA